MGTRDTNSFFGSFSENSEKVDSRDESKCEICLEFCKSTVDRAGRFRGRNLCSKCVTRLAEEETAQKQSEYLERIR